MNTLKIHYRDEEVKTMYESAGIQTEGSAGFDLCCAEDVEIGVGGYCLIDLGVVIQIPKGYHVLAIPRSSTFAKHGIMLANSCGLIDSDYCGPDDFWKFPAYAAPNNRDLGQNKFATKVYISKGTRICQFVLQKTEQYNVEEFTPTAESRGGIGSTGN